MKPQIYAVVKAHTRSYENPIAVVRGEQVTLGRTDPEWPGWRWCTSQSGVAGWVPDVLLQPTGSTAVVAEDYSSMELTVSVGERVRGFRHLAGWTWCQRADGQEGWVPAGALQALEA